MREYPSALAGKALINSFTPSRGWALSMANFPRKNRIVYHKFSSWSGFSSVVRQVTYRTLKSLCVLGPCLGLFSRLSLVLGEEAFSFSELSTSAEIFVVFGVCVCMCVCVEKFRSFCVWVRGNFTICVGIDYAIIR